MMRGPSTGNLVKPRLHLRVRLEATRYLLFDALDAGVQARDQPELLLQHELLMRAHASAERAFEYLNTKWAVDNNPRFTRR